MTIAVITVERFTALEERVGDLEKWAAQFPPLGVISEHGKPTTVTGQMTFKIPPGCVIPAAPVDDAMEATITAMRTQWIKYDNGHIGLLQAVRDGKVPGLIYDDDMVRKHDNVAEIMREQHAEIATLKANIDRQFHDADDLRTRLAAFQIREKEFAVKDGQEIDALLANLARVTAERNEMHRIIGWSHSNGPCSEVSLHAAMIAAQKDAVKLIAHVADLTAKLVEAEKLRSEDLERIGTKDDVELIQRERDALADALWCAEDQWGDDYLWEKWGLSKALSAERKEALKAATAQQKCVAS